MPGSRDDASFGLLLRRTRLAAGLTQEEVAARSGLTARSISNLERGQTRRPFFRSVELLADALEVSPSVRAALRDAALPGAGESGRDAGAGARVTGGEGTDAAKGDHSEWPMCQLPPVVSDFAGRDAECARVSVILARAQTSNVVPIIVLTGPPGVGKTALALRVAHSLRPSFPDGQLYFQLSEASRRPRDASDVLWEVLGIPGFTPEVIPDGTSQRTAVYRSRLADRKVLVVADDARSARQIEPLIPGTWGSALLVTSRSALIDLNGAQRISLGPFDDAEAVELLGNLVGSERVAAEPCAADSLVKACGSLPLAVRIAGIRIASRPGLTIAKAASLIADECHRLDELAVGNLEVRVSTAHSYEELDQRTRRGFRLLALLRSVDVTEWVMTALLGEPAPDDVVNALVDRSLLALRGADCTGESRYRLHHLVADYAAEQLTGDPEEERDSALQRVLAGYLEVAYLASENLPRPLFIPPRSEQFTLNVVPEVTAQRLAADPVAWFTAERLNLLFVTSWACAHDRHRDVARLAKFQLNFQFLWHRLDDAEYIWRVIKAAAERVGDTATILDATFYLTLLSAQEGRIGDALQTLDEKLPTLEAQGQRDTLACALYVRAVCAGHCGRPETQYRDAERCLDLARQLHEAGLEILALTMLGQALVKLGNRDQGLALCAQAVAVAREVHEPAWECYALAGQATSCSVASRHELAERSCLEGLEISNGLSFAATARARLLALLGDAYNGQGRYKEGFDVLQQALTFFTQHGDRLGQALCLLKLGQGQTALGQHRRAGRFMQDCFLIFQELGLHEYEEQAIRALDDCRRAGRTSAWVEQA